MVKGLNEKLVKYLVAQGKVSNCLLEDHLRVTPQRVAKIKSQLSIHEVAVIFLEPTNFKIVAVDVVAWKQFVDGLAGPT